MRELDLALVDDAGDRRGARRIGRAGERDVPFAGEQPGRRIEPDPAGAGQVHLGPGVQIGEVGCGARWTVERLHVGRQLNQVARDEARRQPEVAQHLHQQPAGVAARARARCVSVSSRRLHARLHADDVARSRCDSRWLSSTRKSIVRRRCARRSTVQRTAGAAVPAGSTSRNGASSLGQPRLVGERELLGVRLEEEVERIDDRHLGDEIDFDEQLTRLLREHDTRRGNCCADPAAS